jgi:transposase-like protein
MLQMESEIKVKAATGKAHFSKQTILEIVRAVERGATRREMVNRYGMAKSTLSDWMREYGSPSYLARIKPLSVTDRRSLVRSVEEGRMTLLEAKTAYNLISTDTVRRYLREAEREKAELHRIATLMDKNEVRPEAISSEDVKALKKALEEAELKIKALNTLIDVAEDQFKIPIRKKPGARQS